MITYIKEVWNNANSSATIASLEFPEETGGGAIELAPGERRQISIRIPWCSDGKDFEKRHINVDFKSGPHFSVWQASHDFADRVRVSEGPWKKPGEEIGAFSAAGPLESNLGGSQRTLIMNKVGLWLLPKNLIDLLQKIGDEEANVGYQISTGQTARPVPSVPKKSAVAFSMAGIASDAFKAGKSNARFLYRDSGKRYEFEIRDGDGVVVIKDPPDQGVFIAGVAPLTKAISYDGKRKGEEIPLPEFDLLAASNGRVFAKEKGVDRFYFALLDEMYVYEESPGHEGRIQSTYAKLDPEFNRSGRKVEDLRMHLAEDIHHPAAERFPAFRLGLSLGLKETMIVSVRQGWWHRIDARPPLGLSPITGIVGPYLDDLMQILEEVVPELAPKLINWIKQLPSPPPDWAPKYKHVEWIAAKSPWPPIQLLSVDFRKVLDIGVGHVHHHEQYDRLTGGEMQPLLSTPPSSSFFEDYAKGYRWLNGPVRDGDGFIDGTCNYYVLAQLADGYYAILFMDEQTFFSQRWRILHPDDHKGLMFSLLDNIAADLQRQQPPRRYNFNPKTYWCPFRNRRIGPKSRMAVAAQVILVTKDNPPEPTEAEIYSINFSWATMDRTWRWRTLPVPARYFTDDAAARAETIPRTTCDDWINRTGISGCVYPQTIRLREDMTIHVKGTLKMPDTSIEIGRWYQRYLPASNDLPPVSTSPPKFTHPWKFLPEHIFALADRFSHFGVYDIVDSRMQYYPVQPASAEDARKLEESGPGPWIGDFYIDTYLFRFENLRLPWPPILPGPTAQRKPPSIYNPKTLLRIEKRGTQWIAMHWDKRDDDLLPFSGPYSNVQLSKDGQTVKITLGVNKWVPDPPVVQIACFWWQSTTPGDIRAAFGFSTTRAQSALENVWRVRMAALVPNQPGKTVPLLNLYSSSFKRTVEGFYQYEWRPTTEQQAQLNKYCSESGVKQFGTSVWFEDVTGHVSPPELLAWGRSPGIRYTVTPSTIVLKVPQEVTVTAKDARTGVSLAGKVKVENQEVGNIGKKFTHIFHTRILEGTPDNEPPIILYPKITVSVQAYVDGMVPATSITFVEPQYLSSFVRQSVPSVMTAGQKYPVSVTIRNMGNFTWTSAITPFRLGSQNPPNNSNWGLTRVPLPHPVPPGTEVTFNFSVTAPSVGFHPFQWQMFQEKGVGYFGSLSNKVTIRVDSASPTNQAAFVRQTVPQSMEVTGVYNVSVTMRNTGTTIWESGGSNPYRLGSQSPQDNKTWRLNRVELPGPVPPGAEGTFKFTITPPTVAGKYDFQWRMVREGVEWFGDFTPKLVIDVIRSPIVM